MPAAPGAGRLIAALYALFALAATGRAVVQIATRFSAAPLAYTLTAVAAVIYLVAAWALTRTSAVSRRLAWAACTIELVGVVCVGTLSLATPSLFPDDTVWSHYGSGYGYIPLVLPLLGLIWLARRRQASPAAGPDESSG